MHRNPAAKQPAAKQPANSLCVRPNKYSVVLDSAIASAAAAALRQRSCAQSLCLAEQLCCTRASLSCTCTAAPHENKPRLRKQLMHATNVSVVLNSAIASDGHTCESSGSCAHIIRPTEQHRCTHASLSCTRTAGPHENKPRQSKQLMHAADASVVLNSAIASDGHICESSSGCAHIIRPIEAASLHPRIVIVYKHRKVARKQAAAEQTAHARGNSLGCAYSAIASALAATAQLMVQLSTERKPCLAALQHVRVAFAHKHQSHVRKQAAAAQKARARGKCLGRA